MEGTGNSTSPSSGSESSIVEAGARRLAALQTAAPAPNGQQATQEAQAPTAAFAQSDEPPPDSTPSDGTETAAESGDTGTQDQPALPSDDLVLWHDPVTGAPVTKQEAQRGYLREQDYHAKQTLMSQGRDALMTVLQEAAARNEAAGRRLEAMIPQVDDSLEYTDPALWSAQQIKRYKSMQEVQQLYAQAQQDRRMVAEHEGQQAEAEMPRALPHWQDHGTMLREQELARKYLQAEGYPPAEIERIRSNPWYIRAIVQAARHKPVVAGAAKGGAASAAARAQPSPSIAQSQTRPAPAGTAAFRQQQRGGPAVAQPTRSRGGRATIDSGAARLSPMPITRGR
jgi:hypothetical protein